MTCNACCDGCYDCVMACEDCGRWGELCTCDSTDKLIALLAEMAHREAMDKRIAATLADLGVTS